MDISKNKITLFNVASTIILQGLAFFTGPIFSSALRETNFGIVTVYMTWVQLGATIFSLQAGSSLAIARNEFPAEEQKDFQASILGLATLSYIGFSTLTIIVAFFLNKFLHIDFKMLVMGLCHGWGLYCVTFFNQKFTYEFKADKNFILSIFISITTIGLSIFLIKQFPEEINYWGRVIGLFAVYTFVGVILFIYMIKEAKSLYNKVYWTFALPIAIPTVFHLLANILLNQSDKIMIQQMINNSSAGIYALSCTFGAVINTIWGALNNSWVPFYYEYTSQNKIDKMRKHAKNYIELFTILTMGFILLSREVFCLYAPKAFWEGTDFIPIFALGYYFVFLYSFPVNYEFYHKKTKMIALGTSLAAFCNILLNYIFIKKYGIIGAVFATTIAHGFQFLFHYIMAKKIEKSVFPFAIVDFIPGLFAVCFTCMFSHFAKRILIVRWISGAVLGTYLILKILKRKEIF